MMSPLYGCVYDSIQGIGFVAGCKYNVLVFGHSLGLAFYLLHGLDLYFENKHMLGKHTISIAAVKKYSWDKLLKFSYFQIGFVFNVNK
jgi:hypothetical protein